MHGTVSAECTGGYQPHVGILSYGCEPEIVEGPLPDLLVHGYPTSFATEFTGNN